MKQRMRRLGYLARRAEIRQCIIRGDLVAALRQVVALPVHERQRMILEEAPAGSTLADCLADGERRYAKVTDAELSRLLSGMADDAEITRILQSGRE